MGVPMPRRIACTRAMEGVGAAPGPGGGMGGWRFAGLTSTPFLRAMTYSNRDKESWKLLRNPAPFKGHRTAGAGNFVVSKFRHPARAAPVDVSPPERRASDH